MNSIKLIHRLHQHRQWSNQQLIAIAERLDEQQLRREFEIGQGSIWRSLTHLYAAEYVWLEALLGNENPLAPGDAAGQLPGNQAGDDAAKSVAELKQRWSELDARWSEYLDGLTTETIQQSVFKQSSRGGVRQQTSVTDILLHVCTHAQYTTAQAINMMRHAGVTDLPDPMLITLARSEDGTGS